MKIDFPIFIFFLFLVILINILIPFSVNALFCRGGACNTIADCYSYLPACSQPYCSGDWKCCGYYLTSLVGCLVHKCNCNCTVGVCLKNCNDYDTYVCGQSEFGCIGIHYCMYKREFFWDYYCSGEVCAVSSSWTGNYCDLVIAPPSCVCYRPCGASCDDDSQCKYCDGNYALNGHCDFTECGCAFDTIKNCDSLDYWGSYYCVGDTITRDYYDYYCSAGTCPYNKTTYTYNTCSDYWTNPYCSGDKVQKDFYDCSCVPGSSSCSCTLSQTQVVQDCNSLDSVGPNYCSGNNVVRDVTDGYCDSATATCKTTTTTQTVENCDWYDGWGSYYCVGNTIARNYYDYYCSGGSCTYTTTTYYYDNCDSYDGCYSGYYRDYYCSGGSCDYTVSCTAACDTTPPASPSRSPASRDWANTDVSVTVTYSDPCGITYTRHCWTTAASCDPGTTAANTFTNGGSVTQTTNGAWTLCTRARDGVGNWSGIHCSSQGAYKIDKDPPNPPTMNPVSRDWASTDVSVTVTYTDVLSGIQYTRHCWTTAASCDPGTTAANTFTNGGSVTQTSEGAWTLCTRARDVAGNWRGPDCSASGAYKIDKTAPTTAIKCGDPPGTCITGWYTADVKITLTCSDPGSGCAATYYCVDQANTCDPRPEAAGILYTTPFYVQNEGINWVRYYSVDNTGHTEPIH